MNLHAMVKLVNQHGCKSDLPFILIIIAVSNPGKKNFDVIGDESVGPKLFIAINFTTSHSRSADKTNATA